MMFKILLGISVLVCLVGLYRRFSYWFSQGIHPPAKNIPLSERIFSAIKGTLGVLFSPKIANIVQSLFVDLLFQKRVFDKNMLRWCAHTLIFVGFILLLLMHALDSVVTEALFPDYVSTLNPYLFLRNFFGLMVLVGVGLAIYRRVTLKAKRLRSNNSDWYALAFVGVIALSGMLLEGAKISSYNVFQGMVEEYGDVDEKEGLALEAYWVKENGLVSPTIRGSIDAELVAQGEEVHGSSCIECHSANGSAFASSILSITTRPFSAVIGDSATVGLFWFIHIAACLGLLAWLPFSKMFHVVSAPASLLINSVMGKDVGGEANALTRQAIGLSACTHCGSCSVECSSLVFSESFKNDFILPSEKVQFLKRIAAKEEIDSATLKNLQEGMYVCTSCDRCTNVCPSGINLRDIFIKSRYYLLDKGVPETSMLSHFSFPLALAQNFVDDHRKALMAVDALFKKAFVKLADIAQPLSLTRNKDFVNESYKSCFSCQRCTNICPVVRSYDNPGEELDLLPHQLIYSLGIGNVDLAMGSKMIWSCSTCYLCQEHCPNQVELTDIFYRLKNGAITKVEAGGTA